MHLKDADRMAYNVDLDQTARLGSALFAQICLSENLGSLRYSFSLEPGKIVNQTTP